MMKYLHMDPLLSLSLVYIFYSHTMCTKDSLSDARYDKIITPPDKIVRLIIPYNLEVICEGYLSR